MDGTQHSGDGPEAEQLLAQALEALDVAVCIADARLPDLPLVWVNAAFERTTGWAAHEALGRNCRFLQDGLPPQPEVDVLREALARREPVQVVLRNRRRDGTTFLNELALTPLHDDSGACTHVLALQRDVTRAVHEREHAAALQEGTDRWAQDVQSGLVPQRLPEAPGLDVAVRYLPAATLDGSTAVSGDFYDLYATTSAVGGPATWNAAMGDVAGRGAGAAAYTATVRNLLKGLALRPGSPAEALGLLNDALLDQMGDRFVTVALAQLQVRADVVQATVALAGHPQPILVTDDGATVVGRPGDVLGVLPGAEAADTTLRLQDGDALVLYTDGITEAGPARDQFGEERLLETLAESHQEGAGGMADAVLDAVRQHDGGLDDDAALLVVRADLPGQDAPAS